MKLTNEHLTRQLDILHPDQMNVPITIIGAGAIGSFTTLALAKMGFELIQVFDFDKVEIHNMNCQFFRFSDIGKYKVEALKELVKDFTNVSISANTQPYTDQVFSGIVISAVDSMAVRKQIWDMHVKYRNEPLPPTQAIIDPRMGAEVAQLYTMNPRDKADVEDYTKTLYTDENAVQERCTAKATMYTACMLSGLVAKSVKDLVTNGPYPRVAMWSIKENDFNAWKKK